MNLLNEDFDFSHAPIEARNAFRGVPKKVRVTEGERLFRMITTEDQTRSGNGILTGQWWFDSKVRMRLSQVSARAGSTLPEAAQSRLAVTKKFSPQMEYLCGIVLKKPIYAWYGTARWQVDEALGVTLLGGFEQYFIPSLAVSRGGLFSDVARMETFAYTLG